ncbi:hypothetical protein [Paenibacillus dendritiformis]|uniref:hypothetical protein n=1 Tax=Paenibacillus dendritiformis TaxID=130049 RepID=UPI003CC83937
MNIMNGRLRTAAYGASMLVTLGELIVLKFVNKSFFDKKLQTAVDGREGNPLPARLQRQKYIHCGQRGCRLTDASIDGFSLLRHMRFFVLALPNNRSFHIVMIHMPHSLPQRILKNCPNFYFIAL